MSWEQYFEKNRRRAVRPIYAKAIEFASAIQSEHAIAVDLGCGAGIEAADLLRRGWNVIAIDRELSFLAFVSKLTERLPNLKLKTVCQRFEDLTEIPAAEFIYSYHALPFCQADYFDRLCRLTLEAVKPNGIFAGSFFGLKDEWVRSGHNTGVSSDTLSQYFSSFDVIHFEEIDKVGNTALNGPKHWHFYEVIARSKG